MLNRLIDIMTNLKVNTENIQVNLEKQANSMGGQARMLKLIDEGLSRKESHERLRNAGT